MWFLFVCFFRFKRRREKAIMSGCGCDKDEWRRIERSKLASVHIPRRPCQEGDRTVLDLGGSWRTSSRET